MRGKTSAMILAGGFLLATLECKSATKEQPAPAKAAAPAAPAAAKAAPETKPVAAPVDPRGADFQPFPVGKRPGCKPVPRVVTTAEGTKSFVRTAPLARAWALVSYGKRGPDGPVVEKGDEPVSEFDTPPPVESDYFSGLEPGRMAWLVNGGLTKASALRTKYMRERKQSPLVQPGYFSDHCYDAGADDKALLFSILLSDNLALQVRARWRESQIRDTDKYMPETYEGGEYVSDPIPRKVYNRLTLEDRRFNRIERLAFFTVRLTDGYVVDAKFSDENRYEPAYPTLWPDGFSIAVIGNDDKSPIALSIHGPVRGMVGIVKRDGRIPVLRTVSCEHERLKVGSSQYDGRWHLELLSSAVGPDDFVACARGTAAGKLEEEAALVTSSQPTPKTQR
jgi:hypothetical protein